LLNGLIAYGYLDLIDVVAAVRQFFAGGPLGELDPKAQHVGLLILALQRTVARAEGQRADA